MVRTPCMTFSTIRRAAFLALLSAALLPASRSIAQPPPMGNGLPTPRLLTVMPPGGKAGTVVEITVNGTDTEEPEALLFSHPGIKAEKVPLPPPPPADPKKPAPPPMPPPTNTQFKVTVAADVPLGSHDVRLVNKWGVSNPRAFVVGDLPEVLEKEPNNNDTEAQKVPLNCTVNGVISAPTDVDYFSFTGTKGQRIVISCLALSIDSQLQPALELYDRGGRLLAANFRYQGNRHYFNSDSLVDSALPADGEYVVRLSQFTYTQGDANHFYRLTISTAPWIDAVHPAVVEPGKAATLTVYGRNLPGGKPDPTAVVDGRVLDKLTVTVNVPADPAVLTRLTYSGHLGAAGSDLDGFEHRLRNDVGSSNAFLLTYARAPVVLDNEANDTPETAQEVPLPCEIAGRVEKKHDRDWYTFTAKKGEVWSIEVISDRLGAPTDMYFVLRNPTTKQDIIESDDNPEPPNPKFFARSDDPPVYRFVVPADGKYQLLVASRLADAAADPRHYYRVRITPEQPDFRLVVMPADYERPDGACVRQNGNEFYSVFAWRQDGFRGDIALTVEGLPKGVTCTPQTLPGTMKHGTLVVSAAADAPVSVGEIKVKGTATIKGQPVVREARSASIVWPVQPQQGIPPVSRLDRNLVLAVRGQAPFNLAASITDKPTLIQGEKATLALKLGRLWPDCKTPLNVTLLDPVQNLVINNGQPIAMQPGNDAATAPVVVNANVPPGTYNLVLIGSTQFPYNKDPKAPQKQPIPVVQPATPVALTVLPKTVATVTAALANPNLKVGTDTELIVKVARMHDYAGEFKVQLVLPPNVVGISAAEAIIPAGMDEVKLVLKVPADAAPGPRNELLVRTTAMINGNVPTVQDSAKFNVNVVK
jgi:hypothetical protein